MTMMSAFRYKLLVPPKVDVGHGYSSGMLTVAALAC